MSKVSRFFCMFMILSLIGVPIWSEEFISTEDRVVQGFWILRNWRPKTGMSTSGDETQGHAQGDIAQGQGGATVGGAGVGTGAGDDSAQRSLYGQTRNTVSVKISTNEFDIAGTIAIIPHWYLYASIGGTDFPDDYMEREFKDWECDQKFLYNALVELGYNIRLGGERIEKNPPNLFIGAMMGPAICTYMRDDDYLHNRGYLMARATVGVDVPLYKQLGLTADFSLDKVGDYDLTPRFTVGLQWIFRDWSLSEQR